MTWNQLVNVSLRDNHFKFWSYEVDDVGNMTGRYSWGRIGSTNPQIRIDDPSRITSRLFDKQSEGYQEYGAGINPSPNPQGVRIRYGLNTQADDATRQRTETIRRPAVRHTPTHETIQEEPDEEEPEEDVDDTPGGIPAYQTNRQGLLRTYRRGYERERVLDYTTVNKENMSGRNRIINRTKEFYESIPKNQVAMKRPFGFEYESEQIFGRHAGQYIFVLDPEGEPVACFEITRAGKSNFFYIKSSADNYRYVLKYCLNTMDALASQRPANLLLRIRGKTLINELKELLGNQGFSNDIKDIKKLVVPSRVAREYSIRERPKRWIDVGD